MTLALRIRLLKCYNLGDIFFFLLSVREEVTGTKVVIFAITCQVILGKATTVGYPFSPPKRLLFFSKQINVFLSLGFADGANYFTFENSKDPKI